jgi:hypothetical protein
VAACGRWVEKNGEIFTLSNRMTMIHFCLIAVVVFFTLFFYAVVKFHKEVSGIIEEFPEHKKTVGFETYG